MRTFCHLPCDAPVRCHVSPKINGQRENQSRIAPAVTVERQQLGEVMLLSRQPTVVRRATRDEHLTAGLSGVEIVIAAGQPSGVDLPL